MKECWHGDQMGEDMLGAGSLEKHRNSGETQVTKILGKLSRRELRVPIGSEKKYLGKYGR